MIVRLRRQLGQFITSGAQLLLLLIGAKLDSRAGWLVCVGLMASISLVAWLLTLRRRRAIADTPTSRIASAAQGYVELRGIGKALDDPPLFSHRTARPCLWYRHQLEEKSAGDKWQTISSDESEAAFILDDGSGRCVIDVDGAEILTRHKATWVEDRYRHTEWTLLIDDPIYALGEFRSIGGGTLELDAHADLGALLGEWKKDQGELLKRFDLNADGCIDVQEWALARQAARREVAKLHREARNEADVHTLRAPSGGQLHLISNLDPDRIARRYLYWAIFHLGVFFASLGALPWLWRQAF
jgi:hypothetical protein